jgi:hypothetical protein
VGKANYARNGERDALRLGRLGVLESDLSPDQTRNDDVIRANGENEAFLRCLAKCTEQRRNVSHQPGTNYAPKTFAGMPEAKGIKQAAFAAAMERLLHLGQIVVDSELWRAVTVI